MTQHGMKIMRLRELIKRKSNMEIWLKILGRLPIGTVVRCRDKRYKKGYVEGIIHDYFPYWGHRKGSTNPRYFAYNIDLSLKESYWPYHVYKSPFSVIKILPKSWKKKNKVRSI